MIFLGIETSCDETAAAVVENGVRIRSNIISSQIALHRRTGGVVPEAAAREHVARIIPVYEQALKRARVTLRDIDAIAVTAGPGLLSSLLIGVNAAMTFALAAKKPLIAVNHIEGHIYANMLRSVRGATKIHFPAAVLTVSGGHTELMLWRGHGDYKALGATLDDAAGEAFDKVARLLGLPYPGGPAIERAAALGNSDRYPLPRAWVTKWNFSFSGLKTAMLRLTQSQRKIREQFVFDAAASFQESVCEVLSTKLILAAKKFKAKEIHLAGGVSANTRLRAYAAELLQKNGLDLPLRFCRDLSLCTDNAAMIASAGYFKYKKNPALYKKWCPVAADPNLKIKKW